MLNAGTWSVVKLETCEVPILLTCKVLKPASAPVDKAVTPAVVICVMSAVSNAATWAELNTLRESVLKAAACAVFKATI